MRRAAADAQPEIPSAEAQVILILLGWIVALGVSPGLIAWARRAEQPRLVAHAAGPKVWNLESDCGVFHVDGARGIFGVRSEGKQRKLPLEEVMRIVYEPHSSKTTGHARLAVALESAEEVDVFTLAPRLAGESLWDRYLALQDRWLEDVGLYPNAEARCLEALTALESAFRDAGRELIVNAKVETTPKV